MEDSVIEKRHGEFKSFDAGLPIISDCLPHIFSIISKIISIDVSYKSIKLKVDHGGSKVKMKIESSGIPIEICLIRNGSKRTRLVEAMVEGKNNTLDFSTEPGLIKSENTKINADANWNNKSKPLKQLLNVFLFGVKSRKFDDRLDFQFGIKIVKLIEESQKIYKKFQLRWVINKIKIQNHLDSDLAYAINELNLCYELDLNHEIFKNKLSYETKISLLKKFNYLLNQK